MIYLLCSSEAINLFEPSPLLPIVLDEEEPDTKAKWDILVGSGRFTLYTQDRIILNVSIL